MSKDETVPNLDIVKFSYSLQTTHFRKSHIDDFTQPAKWFGDKALKDEKPHRDFIGKNPSKCRELYGLGRVLKSINVDFGFDSLDNHVWIKQTNLSCSECKPMAVCLNCGSLILNGKFIPYTDLKLQAKPKSNEV